MPSKKTAFAVGLFMIIGLSIAVVAIIWLGMSNYFQKGQKYVAFFDESVQGLDKDSPVKYRGVSIGRVESVGVAPDGNLIEVIIAIEEKMRLKSDMVAQLKSVGITGIMFIEIDRRKEEEPEYLPPISFYTPYPIVRTKPSGITMFMEGMEEVLHLVNKVDTEGMSDKLKETVDIVNQILKDAQIKTLASDLNTLLVKIDMILEAEKWQNITDSIEKTTNSLNHLIIRTDKMVSDINTSTVSLLSNADNAVNNINKTITSIEGIVSHNEKEIIQAVSDIQSILKTTDTVFNKGNHLITDLDVKISGLHRYLLVTLQNLENISENLNRFADTIGNQPSQLIFGEPVPAKEADR